MLSAFAPYACAVHVRRGLPPSTSTGTTTIQSSAYKLLHQVDEGTETTELTEENKIIVPESGSCKITLSADGTEGATGYCGVKVGDAETLYFSKQITVCENDKAAFTFTVNAVAGTEITLTPKWGSCAVRDESNTITNGGSIGTPPNALSEQAGDSAAADKTGTVNVAATPVGSQTKSDAAAQNSSTATPTQPESIAGTDNSESSSVPGDTAADRSEPAAEETEVIE